MGLVNTQPNLIQTDLPPGIGSLSPSTDSQNRTLLDEVVQGLQKDQKTLPCKLFYDLRGSQLFDQICNLAEYYPTRTEAKIMTHNIREIAETAGTARLIIEYGSGSSLKTRALLDHLPNLCTYVPVDISRDHLFSSVDILNRDYPQLEIFPVWADFTKELSLPHLAHRHSPKLAFFPGSTFGNFYPQQGIDFMKNVAKIVGPGSGFLVGIDLQKDPAILNAAYNDRQGVTAAFNRNILTHLNREYHTDFNENQFEHLAFYNEKAGRIEMHLVSNLAQRVHLNGLTIEFRKGETILTEVSYKFTLEGFARLADKAGFVVRNFWVDHFNFFSVQYLAAK